MCVLLLPRNWSMISITTDGDKGFRVIEWDRRNNVFCVAKIYEKSGPGCRIEYSACTDYIFAIISESAVVVWWLWYMVGGTVAELSWRFTVLCRNVYRWNKRIATIINLTQFRWKYSTFLYYPHHKAHNFKHAKMDTLWASAKLHWKL